MTAVGKKILIGGGAASATAVGGGALAYNRTLENGPGNIAMTVGEFLNKEGWRKFNESLEKINNKEKCEGNNLHWDGTTGKCSFPKYVTKVVHLGIEDKVLSTKNIVNCINGKGYWWEYKSTGEKCQTIDIILRPRLGSNIYRWNLIKEEDMKERDQSAVQFVKDGFIEVRKNGEKAVAIFKEEKLTKEQKNNSTGWFFPSHFNANGKILEMHKVCKLLEELTPEENGERYLYTQHNNYWWDCNGGGFMWIVE